MEEKRKQELAKKEAAWLQSGITLFYSILAKKAKEAKEKEESKKKSATCKFVEPALLRMRIKTIQLIQLSVH